MEMMYITLYADDAVLYMANQCSRLATGTDLSKLTSWCNENRLTINVKKTKYMVVSPVPLRENRPLRNFYKLVLSSFISI